MWEAILHFMGPPSHEVDLRTPRGGVGVRPYDERFECVTRPLAGPKPHIRDGEKRMSTRVLSAIAIAFLGIGLQAGIAQARTVVVGSDPTCQDGIKERYSTIQAAVNASAVGGAVLVCPGTYPEQVVLTMPLIIKGVTNPGSNQSSAIVTVPAGGLAVNVSNGTDVAQIVVQGFNSGQAQIVNLIVDGAGGGCSLGPTSGIKLYNVGDATWTSSSGVVSGVVVRNECGDAVNAENSFITVQNSIMHDVGVNGITTNGGDTLINNNTMHNINVWGVSVSGGVNSVVSNNVLASQRGINVDGGSTGVQVTGNTIGPYTGTAILAQYSSGLNIKSNKVHGAYSGVWLYQVSGSMVMSNTLSNLYGFGIVDEASHAGNTIQNNVLTEMPKGIVTYNSDTSGDVVTPNTFNQVDVMNTNTLW
jgi:parallel beta-helix repeat protein